MSKLYYHILFWNEATNQSPQCWLADKNIILVHPTRCCETALSDTRPSDTGDANEAFFPHNPPFTLSEIKDTKIHEIARLHLYFLK